MGFEGKKSGMEFKHPAWKKGRDAFKAGKRFDANPYTFGTDAYEAWAQGWQEALSAAG